MEAYVSIEPKTLCQLRGCTLVLITNPIPSHSGLTENVSSAVVLARRTVKYMKVSTH